MKKASTAVQLQRAIKALQEIAESRQLDQALSIALQALKENTVSKESAETAKVVPEKWLPSMDPPDKDAGNTGTKLKKWKGWLPSKDT